MFIISTICWLFGWSFHHIAVQFNTITILNIETVVNLFHKVCFSAYLSAILAFISAFILASVEIVRRLKKDSFENYLKSVYQTFSFRIFLFQREKLQKVSNFEHQTVTTINPIPNGFNKAVSKCIVDIRLDSVTVFVKVPRDQQGQKILKEMEAHLKEEIASQHTDYYFSSPHRIHNQLWFIGKKC